MKAHLHERQDVLDGPSPRRWSGRLVALSQAAAVYEVLRVQLRVVLVEADGPDEPDQRLDGRRDRHHPGTPSDLGVGAIPDVVGAHPVAALAGEVQVREREGHRLLEQVGGVAVHGRQQLDGAGVPDAHHFCQSYTVGVPSRRPRPGGRRMTRPWTP